MPTPVIAAARRTPQGVQDGVFVDVRSEDLSVAVVDQLLDDTGLTSDHIEDLLWGCAQQRTEQDNNIARVIALLSALGEGVPAATINRWCASSMQAIISAADAIAAGNRDCVIAGGVENMSRVPMDAEAYQHLHAGLAKRYNVFELQMGMTAETVADKYGISRDDQDATRSAATAEPPKRLIRGGSTTNSLPSTPKTAPSPKTKGFDAKPVWTHSQGSIRRLRATAP